MFHSPVENTVCYFLIITQWLNVLLQHQNLLHTISKLEKVFAQFEIQSDDGPPFQSDKFRSYARQTGFRHRKITPGHPEANGQAERFVRTVKICLKVKS